VSSLRTRYGAPWSRELMVMSAVGLLTLVPATAYVFHQGGLIVGTLLATLTVVVISTTVRGYDIAADQLRIRRLFWSTRWPLTPATKATVRPGVMACSWRLWGNGGFFAFSGRFSNSELGRYHAFVTDFDRTVVLHTSNGPLVVSPDDPGQFASTIDALTQPART
jgi:hypothetical protein